jgi:uncharacterized membrane protein YheB (UPF0754 family)
MGKNLQLTNKGGENMPRYRDDLCERCGATRVVKSDLCAECLINERAFLEKHILIKGVVIEMLTKKLETQTGRLQDALNYGFRKNQENALLLRSHKRLEDMLEEVRKDGSDEQTESKRGKV